MWVIHVKGKLIVLVSVIYVSINSMTLYYLEESMVSRAHYGLCALCNVINGENAK